MSVQDEGGDPATALVDKAPGTHHSRRSRSNLAPVEEQESFEDAFDLADEQSWSATPKDQMDSKFSLYRRLCLARLREAEEQRQLTVAKTQRKVQQLKSQFVEHKTKWEAERKLLIQQVEQAQQLQTDAEKEADLAMTQLEDFITEQEKLEEEEEARRSTLLGARSHSSLTLGAKSPQTLQPAATPQTPATPRSAGEATSGHPSPPESRSTHNSEELQRLMKQTDDAKVEELKERLTGTKSAPPEVGTVKTGKPGSTTLTSQLRQTSPAENAGGCQDGDAAGLQDLPLTLGVVPDIEETPQAGVSGKEPTSYASAGDLIQEAVPDKGETDVALAAISGTQISEEKERSQCQEGVAETLGDSTNSFKAASKTPDMKLSGETEEGLREASARSRASLRNQFRTQLSESRQAAEDRRSRTPQITLPTKLSVDDELVVEDDDDDDFDEMALPDDLKEELEEQRRKDVYEIGTSPPPGPLKGSSSFSGGTGSRKSSSLQDALLKEFLLVHSGVTGFKDTLSKLFLDKDMMSASQILSDLETVVFDKDQRVFPQVDQLTANALYILEEVGSVISSAVMVDREPVVSSLLPFSRDDTRPRPQATREASEDMSYASFTQTKGVTPASASGMDQLSDPSIAAAAEGVSVETKGSEVTGRASAPGSLAGAFVHGPGSQAGSAAGSRKSSVVSGTTKQYLAELQTQCLDLQTQLEDEMKRHEEQLRHNTVVMMEMQDTINELQRELSTLGKAKKPRSAASSALGVKTPSPDQSLMFTRLDLERNAKIMKKAVMDQRLDVDRYKEVVTTMDDYVSLPAPRLAHLVKKYVHHSRMKEIEENVKNSNSLDEQAFDTLDKMEALQNQRARLWAEKMDVMGLERLRLAAMLMDSLDSIEQESGLFLIKPMYSFRGRELKAPPTQKLARPARTQPVTRHQSAAVQSTTSFVPAPTPTSHVRRTTAQTPTHPVPAETMSYRPLSPSRLEDGVIGSRAISNPMMPQQDTHFSDSYPTWNIQASQARLMVENGQHPLNTPRMLELDINRMLIGQNNISTKLPHRLTDDRLVNASNNSLRSYITVQRPTASLAHERPPSENGGREAGAPSSSLRPHVPVPVSAADRDVPVTLASPPPLPPIGDRTGSAGSRLSAEEPELERNQPGLTMCVSTAQE